MIVQMIVQSYSVTGLKAMGRSAVTPPSPDLLTTHGVRQLFHDSAAEAAIRLQVLGVYRCTSINRCEA